jgi:8-amino-7-oxononanoate synthase
MNTFQEHCERLLSEKGGAHRKLRAFTQYHPRFLTLKEDGVERRFLNFASNDYLGLSQVPLGEDNPLSSQYERLNSQPSSRLLGGNTSEQLKLEQQLAEHWGKESGLFFPTGYMANLGVLSCLPQKDDLVLLDRSAHASLLDGVRLSEARWKRYRHLDLNHLEKELKAYSGPGVIWVVTESLFSMDGDLPDAQKLKQLKAKYGFYLVVDEAHGVGVYGEQGRGWFDEQGALDAIDVLTFNFSKSFAMQGGCILGSSSLIRYLVAHCRSQIYTTATPISHLRGLDIRLEQVAKANVDRAHLKECQRRLCEKLNVQINHSSPIVPIFVGEGERALKLSEKLWEAGVFCPAILPPTIPVGEAKLRVSLNASHLFEDVDALASIIGAGIREK